ncbi:hypothetical protein [Flavobacterium urumqiense]|nr:hypothetical protein [Flavobacterium urumqiense]
MQSEIHADKPGKCPKYG